jgi:hypothetical protein
MTLTQSPSLTCSSPCLKKKNASKIVSKNTKIHHAPKSLNPSCAKKPPSKATLQASSTPSNVATQSIVRALTTTTAHPTSQSKQEMKQINDDVDNQW